MSLLNPRDVPMSHCPFRFLKPTLAQALMPPPVFNQVSQGVEWIMHMQRLNGEVVPMPTRPEVFTASPYGLAAVQARDRHQLDHGAIKSKIKPVRPGDAESRFSVGGANLQESRRCLQPSHALAHSLPTGRREMDCPCRCRRCRRCSRRPGRSATRCLPTTTPGSVQRKFAPS